MHDLFSSGPPILVLLLVALCLLLMALPPTLAAPRWVRQAPACAWSYRQAQRATLAFGLLLMLSGCGTLHSQDPPPMRLVHSCPPVPADLMVMPQQPVLLQPSTSRTSSTTTWSTPAAAPKTAPPIGG